MNQIFEEAHPRDARNMHVLSAVGHLIAYLIVTQKIAAFLMEGAVKQFELARQTHDLLKQGFDRIGPADRTFHVKPDGETDLVNAWANVPYADNGPIAQRERATGLASLLGGFATNGHGILAETQLEPEPEPEPEPTPDETRPEPEPVEPAPEVEPEPEPAAPAPEVEPEVIQRATRKGPRAVVSDDAA